MKCFIFILFLSGVLCGENCGGDDEEYYARLDQITPEDPCSRVGGVCTFAEDCPALTDTSGQCPRQQSQGVECCYGTSVRDTRCRTNGGECMAVNSCRPEFERATDCNDGQKCCILIN